MASLGWLREELVVEEEIGAGLGDPENILEAAFDIGFIELAGAVLDGGLTVAVGNMLLL